MSHGVRLEQAPKKSPLAQNQSDRSVSFPQSKSALSWLRWKQDG
ncbi:hypothetical protein [Azospirillum argentinense]